LYTIAFASSTTSGKSGPFDLDRVQLPDLFQVQLTTAGAVGGSVNRLVVDNDSSPSCQLDVEPQSRLVDGRPKSPVFSGRMVPRWAMIWGRRRR
jgi:hypothetical protein